MERDFCLALAEVARVIKNVPLADKPPVASKAAQIQIGNPVNAGRPGPGVLFGLMTKFQLDQFQRASALKVFSAHPIAVNVVAGAVDKRVGRASDEVWALIVRMPAWAMVDKPQVAHF